MENRVHSIALVHESLYGSENLARIDFAEYAQGLAEDILVSHGSPTVPVRQKTELEPVTMGADLAVPCGLILNELVSNAFKHGFPKVQAEKSSSRCAAIQAAAIGCVFRTVESEFPLVWMSTPVNRSG